MTDYLARALEQDAGEDQELAAEQEALPEGTVPPRIFEKPRAKAAVSNDTHPAADAPTSRPGGASDPSGESGREAERPLAEALSALDRALGDGGAVSNRRSVRSTGETGPEADGTARSVRETAGSSGPDRAAGADAPESPVLQTLERAARPFFFAEKSPAARESVPSDAPGPAAVPQSPDAALPLLDRVRRAQRGESFVRSEKRAFTVTLPEAPAAAPAWSVEDLDRAVEQDARRSGGDFRLY